MATDVEKKYRPWVIVASIVVPIVVAALFGIKIDGVDTSFLPPIYASINGITAIVLVLAVIAIKKGNRDRHQKLMTTAVVLSILFLVGYVTYHITSDSTLYGDTNRDHAMSPAELESVKSSALIYYVILISHILLSILVIPLVMMTYLKGWAGNIVSHKKWAKKTFPIWLYVAVSGVVVYLMIRPYY
jgi:putative membrane protein